MTKRQTVGMRARVLLTCVLQDFALHRVQVGKCRSVRNRFLYIFQSAFVVALKVQVLSKVQVQRN